MACQRWAPGDVTPAELDRGQIERLRIATAEGRWVLYRPSVSADSLLGFEKQRTVVGIDPGARTHTPRLMIEQRRAVAMSDITRIERRRVDVAATVALAAAGAAVGFVAAFAIACAVSCGGW